MDDATRDARSIRGERTRARILAAAIELLGREGPDGFSAATLARESGVAKATVFHHFDTVDAIPLIAFEELLLETMTRDRYAELDLRAFLKVLGQEVRATAREHRGFLNAYFVFFTKALFDEKLRERLVHAMQQMHVGLRAAVGAHRPPEAPVEQVDALVHLLGATLDGLGLNLLLLDDEDLFDRAWSELVDLVLARLEPPAASALRSGAPS